MSTPFDEFMTSIGAKPVDPAMVKAFEDNMRTDVIPKIQAYRREQFMLAEQARKWVIG